MNGYAGWCDRPDPSGIQARRQSAPTNDGKLDHRELVSRLVSSYDGWALSTSAAALQEVLLLCPPDVRVAAWFRSARPGRSYSLLSAWEPVVYRRSADYVRRNGSLILCCLCTSSRGARG